MLLRALAKRGGGVEKVHLQNNGTLDVPALAECLRDNSTLTGLSLRENKALVRRPGDGDGVSALGAALSRNNALRVLDLRGCKLTGIHLRAFTQGLNPSPSSTEDSTLGGGAHRLQALNLSFNDFSIHISPTMAVINICESSETLTKQQQQQPNENIYARDWYIPPSEEFDAAWSAYMSEDKAAVAAALEVREGGRGGAGRLLILVHVRKPPPPPPS